MDILARYRYLYDPNHNDKPAGNWKRTKSGWSTTENTDSFSETGDGFTRSPEDDYDEDETKEKAETTTDAPNQEQPQKLELNPTPNEGEKEKNEDESLFDKGGEGDEFVTDEEGKEEEDKDKEKAEQPADESEANLMDDEGIFADENANKYLDQNAFQQYMEMLKAFISKFDEGEGKENDVTFKAIVSNLDWSSLDDVKAFSEHCKKKGIEGSDDVLAFLYFQNKENKDKFDQIVSEMD